MMFNAIKTLGLAAATFIMLTAPAAMAQTARGFSIQNTNTTVAVKQVWTKRSGLLGDVWTEIDLAYPIGPKTASNFTLGGTSCLYDVRVKFADGEEQEFDSVNVCRGQAITAT